MLVTVGKWNHFVITKTLTLLFMKCAGGQLGSGNNVITVCTKTSWKEVGGSSGRREHGDTFRKKKRRRKTVQWSSPPYIRFDEWQGSKVHLTAICTCRSQTRDYQQSHQFPSISPYLLLFFKGSHGVRYLPGTLRIPISSSSLEALLFLLMLARLCDFWLVSNTNERMLYVIVSKTLSSCLLLISWPCVVTLNIILPKPVIPPMMNYRDYSEALFHIIQGLCFQNTSNVSNIKGINKIEEFKNKSRYKLQGCLPVFHPAGLYTFSCLCFCWFWGTASIFLQSLFLLLYLLNNKP